MWTILLALLVFSVMVVMHEFGHFIFARIFKVKVNEFAIGMGPKLFSIKGKKTEYSLRLFPIGGFCSMAGEEELDDSPESLCNKPIWQRLIIMAAGAFMNILFGFLITCVIVSTSPYIGSRTVAQFSEGATSSAEGGLMVNDEITKIGKHKIYTASDLSYFILHDGVKPVDIEVIRNGEKQILNDVEFAKETVDGIEIAKMDFKIFAEKKTFGNVVYNSFFEAFSNIRMIWSSLIDMVTGRYGLESASGPVGATTAIGEAAKSGILPLLYMVSFISMNLGVFNLLPIPALDGGHIVFLLIELIRGKPIKKEHESYVHLIGFALLILLMLYVTFNDVLKLLA